VDKKFYKSAKNCTFAHCFKADNMAKKKNTGQDDILKEGNEKLTDAFNNAEYFFEQYKNIILGVIAVVVIGVGGWWGYKNFVKGPKETKAKDAIIYAQKYFEMDSMRLALKGDGQHLGYEAIAKQYSGTAAGSRATFGAGICNLKLGNYAEAVKFLSDFSSSDALLTARKFGCLGDAYAEQNQMDKAIENYKKAIDAADNEITTSTYLYRLALAFETKGNKKEAIEAYKRVNTEYPDSQEGMAAEIAIARLEAQAF
jgi:tetratricopeptide (TPR) repeat protein